MTEPGDQSPASPDPDAAPTRPARRPDAGVVADVCPLLQSPDGGWRSAYASRDHRCWAITPPAQLAVAKQRQLCLVPGHAGCSTYIAAAGDWSEPMAAASRSGVEASLLWPAVRSTPLALEPSRGRTGSRPVAPGRAGGQTLLVALMVLAFLVLVIARTSAPSAQGPSSSAGAQAGVAASEMPAGATGSPGPAAGASPSASPAGPTTSPQPTSSASPRATPAPTKSAPAPTKAPAGTRRYTVQTGDTLSGIAARFGTTVTAIKVANRIKDPRLIRVGQVLVIP